MSFRQSGHFNLYWAKKKNDIPNEWISAPVILATLLIERIMVLEGDSRPGKHLERTLAFVCSLVPLLVA